MKKIVLICAYIMVLVIFLSACGTGGSGYVSTDFNDFTPEQQRFLVKPEANVMINPKSFKGESENEQQLNNNTMNIGVVDTSGDSPVITKELEQVFYFVESKTSNFLNGERLFEMIFEEPSNMVYTKNEMDVVFDGTKVTFNVAADKPDPWAWFSLRKSSIKIDFSKDVYMSISIPVCEQGIAIKMTPSGIAETLVHPDGMFVGEKSMFLNEILQLNNVSKTCTIGFFALGQGQKVVCDKFVIDAFDRGFINGKESLTSFSPTAIKNTTSYPQGLALFCEDFYANENAIIRRYTATGSGAFGLAGKYDGKISYDSKNGYIAVENDKDTYVILSKRKGAILYFQNEEDMLNYVNFSETPSASGYWLLNLGLINQDAESTIAFLYDTQKTDIATLAATAKDLLSNASMKAIEEENTAFWDEYVSKTELPNEYIINLPK